MYGLLALGAPHVQDGAACDEGAVHGAVVDGATREAIIGGIREALLSVPNVERLWVVVVSLDSLLWMREEAGDYGVHVHSQSISLNCFIIAAGIEGGSRVVANESADEARVSLHSEHGLLRRQVPHADLSIASTRNELNLSHKRSFQHRRDFAGSCTWTRRRPSGPTALPQTAWRTHAPASSH